MRFSATAVLLLVAACSRPDNAEEVPLLPEQDAETAKILMTEAERAAVNAAARAETSDVTARSAHTSVNEVTP